MGGQIDGLVARYEATKAKAQAYRAIEASANDTNKRIGAATAAKHQENLAENIAREIEYLKNPPPKWQFWKHWGRGNW